MKAIIIGGGNGIGLAIALNLIERGFHVVVLDICEPTEIKKEYTYIYCDLLNLDEEMIQNLALDEDVKMLMITAGIGRVAEFENINTFEIEKNLTVNTTAAIKIIRIFYDRIKGADDFYCGIMGSIAGLVSSPMFSVYAASKAGICRFVESVNIEIEAAGYKNRILNVSPGSIKGTNFNGEGNDIGKIMPLAAQITEQLLLRSELFIPQYNEIFKDVIDRYNKDAHEYGMYSYKYKLQSKRNTDVKMCIGYLSGTFDLFHIGHLNLIKKAKEKCDYLIVGVHENGAWKNKETFIPLEERKAILAACKYVDKVVNSCREDSDAWELWHYNRLFVGSDYKGTERFKRYEDYFKDKDVEIIYFPYTQSTSSSQIRELINKE